jgi:hypothetical protein
LNILKTIQKFLLAGAILAVLFPGMRSPARLGVQAAPGLPPVAYLPFLNAGSAAPTLSGCDMFPANNIWNKRIDGLPVHTRSVDWINSISYTRGLHPDFGANWNGGPFGIPYNVVGGSQAKVNVPFRWGGESDPGPYPIPSNPQIEKGGDAHILILDQDNCVVYELYAAAKTSANTWKADSGAIFNLRSNQLRPVTWTSADAAGLPILPGLVRYDEVASGSIRHAIRFTTSTTQKAYLWPARHEAGSSYSENDPPMGARFRLKASVNISGFDPRIQVMFKAFKEYGLILADNGSPWYISGVPDALWDDELLVDSFSQLHGSDFEAVDESGLMIDPNSGQSR